LKLNLNIEPVREARATFKDTQLIEVYYRHSNPELAAFIVNGIVETFSKANQEKRTGTSSKTSDFLADRITSLTAEIKANETKLVNMKASAGIINTEGEQTIVGERLAGLNKQRLDAENNRKNAEAQYKSVSDSPERLKSQAEELAQRYFAERETVIRGIINEARKKLRLESLQSQTFAGISGIRL
jgi:uncharacterized protein involved in exopolysaccharide biosynthesis